MFEILKELCSISGTSGDEGRVNEYIISKIDGFCDYTIDNLGNIIAFKKGKNKPKFKIQLDAHTDEVGLIITGITVEGFLRFETVGGIYNPVLLSRRVIINNEIIGVICSKPIHLMSSEEKSKCPEISDMYIDIGARDRKEANEKILPGDTAVFYEPYSEFGDGLIMSKALDDRVGCAILIDLIRNDAQFDFYATFSAQEEVGLRGAKTASFTVGADMAIAVETTGANDLPGVSDGKNVCNLGKGPAVSFMDARTLYDKKLFDAAFKVAKRNNIVCQPKTAVSGGNDAGAIQSSKEGVRVLAISVPCRYIHTSASVVSKSDIVNARDLVKKMCEHMASGAEV